MATVVLCARVKEEFMKEVKRLSELYNLPITKVVIGCMTEGKKTWEEKQDARVYTLVYKGDHE